MAQILAFSGSNNSRSMNQKLIQMAAQKSGEHSISVVDIRDYPLPIYSPDIEYNTGYPENVKRFRESLDQFDGYIIASPEYNGMVPAVFKNLIDWLSRISSQAIFQKKPVLLLSTSPGATGGISNLTTLAGLMPRWGADIKGHHAFGNFNDILDGDKLNLENDQKLDHIMADFLKTFI